MVDGGDAGARRRRAPERDSRGGRRRAAAAVVLLLATAAGAATGALTTHRTSASGPAAAQATAPASSAPPSPRAAQPLRALVPPGPLTSVDPVGGSGFAPPSGPGAPPGASVTQHYASAHFGGLKSGVGLLADFGRAVEVRQVRLRAVSPGVTVELRAGDAPPTGSDPLAVVVPARVGTGATALAVGRPAPHRYWLVWVAALAPDGGGTYWAALSGVTFLG